MTDPGEMLRTIARLEARVAALERLLADRSREIRTLAREICDDDLVLMSRMAAGEKPLAGQKSGFARWVETTVLTPADVETTMKELWRSTAPRKPEEE